jgi:hypothetical protein
MKSVPLISWWLCPDEEFRTWVAHEAPLMAGRTPKPVAESLQTERESQAGRLKAQQLRGPQMTRRGGSPREGIQWT